MPVPAYAKTGCDGYAISGYMPYTNMLSACARACALRCFWWPYSILSGSACPGWRHRRHWQVQEQFALQLTDVEMAELVAFLESLSGENIAELVAEARQARAGNVTVDHCH
jgi:hypothetical protein